LASDLAGKYIRPPVAVDAKLTEPLRTPKAEIARKLQARHSRNLIPAILEPFAEHDCSPLDELFPVEICPARRGDCHPGGSTGMNLRPVTVLPEFEVGQLCPEER